ncbi:hypothetical protein DPEC_G00143930 [Dallia pectoralis]|uniref:Uncharacterized protein n=1 Tax=Dallia pectoralis TaxID=75939 RepID=A0ACC2GNF8_DALPE|nr:hypothetical protein DPEC_G00143930 [Dallia pectoralis]
MHLCWWITATLLSLSAHLDSVQSLECDRLTQYSWHTGDTDLCCLKCKKGQHMSSRCSGGKPETKCSNCPDGYYSDSYNIRSECESCHGCSMSEGLEKVSSCTTEKNDVCRCKAGFRCKGTGPCLECEKIQPPNVPSPRSIETLPSKESTAKPKIPNPITRPVTPPDLLPITKHPIDDRQWIPLFVAAICVCLLIVLMFAVSKLISMWHWIDSRDNCWSTHKKALANQSTEEVPMPVQEECGKSDLLLDIWEGNFENAEGKL